MRAWCLLGLLLAACGSDDGSSTAAAGTPDGPFRRWPEDVELAVRLPAPAEVEGRPDAFQGLLRVMGATGRTPFGYFFGADAPDGIARERAPWMVVTGSGWMRALPANDLAALNRAMAGQPPEVLVQQLDGFVVLYCGTRPQDRVEADLPPGDLAIRVRHHPVLSLLAETGDTLEAAIVLGGGGFDASGRLTPGPGSPTSALLAAAKAGEGGLLDFLPPGLFLRVEMTLPAAALAHPVTRRLAEHLGFPEAGDRVVVERFLREVLTGAAPSKAIAFGCEVRGTEVSFVVVAHDVEGQPSPVLAKLREADRYSFGPLVFDPRTAGRDLCGWYAWVAQAQPQIEHLPECLWDTVGGLADEEKGLPVAYAAFDGWSVLAAGPRADSLVRATRSRLLGGSERSAGAVQLFRLRGRGEGDYVLGIVVEPGLAELPAADSAALRASFGLSADGQPPGAIAVAGFRADGALKLLARALY